MVGSGMFDGLQYIFYVAILGVVLFIGAIVYGGYKFYEHYYMERTMVSEQRIVPELRLTIKDNKVDTLFVYKFKN